MAKKNVKQLLEREEAKVEVVKLKIIERIKKKNIKYIYRQNIPFH